MESASDGPGYGEKPTMLWQPVVIKGGNIYQIYTLDTYDDKKDF
jgi:hypothetical protein